jgi:hypothetical protein
LVTPTVMKFIVEKCQKWSKKNSQIFFEIDHFRRIFTQKVDSRCQK